MEKIVEEILNKAEVDAYLCDEDYKDIAKVTELNVHTVRKVANGEIKRSKCKKYILARIRKNKELLF
jgi:methyl coenzyme M reductase subunit C-like uncharacterized protein (methanogenesis marker protein 7)